MLCSLVDTKAALAAIGIDMSDKVKPDYYIQYPIQPREIAVKNNLGAMEYYVIKRMHRWNHPRGKGLEDLKKAQDEIQYLIDCVERGDIEI